MNEITDTESKDSTVALPTPPAGGTVRETIEWLEKQNKIETKEQRNSLRVKIEKQLLSILGEHPAVRNQPANSLPRVTWNLLLQKHVDGLAQIAGSPYKRLRAKVDDKDLTPRATVLEQRLEALLIEFSSQQGINTVPVNLISIASHIDSKFKDDRSLRNVILQRSHAITRVNNFILNTYTIKLLNQKMTTYYKTIGKFISDTSKSYENSQNTSSIAQANARRHANEWVAFAQKYLITSLKVREDRAQKLVISSTNSRYSREIEDRLMSNNNVIAISSNELSPRTYSKKSADFVLKNGIDIDFKALGSKGFVALATLPPELRKKPFRILAEFQQMAEREVNLPEMNISFFGNPPTALEVSIGASSSADIYEDFASFIVKAFSTIR